MMSGARNPETARIRPNNPFTDSRSPRRRFRQLDAPSNARSAVCNRSSASEPASDDLENGLDRVQLGSALMSRSVTLQAREPTFSTSGLQALRGLDLPLRLGAVRGTWRRLRAGVPMPSRFEMWQTDHRCRSGDLLYEELFLRGPSHRHALGSSKRDIPDVDVSSAKGRILNHQSFPTGERAWYAAASRTRSRISSGLSTLGFIGSTTPTNNLPRAAMLSNDPEHAFGISLTG